MSMKRKTGALGAVILAAGDSSRMGRPKALLSVPGEKARTFLSKIIVTAATAGLQPVRIVAGRHKEQITHAYPDLVDNLIENPQPELGQLHSLRLGLESIGEEVEGAVVFLVDHPLMSVETVKALMGSFFSTGNPIVIPQYKGRRGHPVLFGRQIFGELSNAPLNEGARFVVRSNPDLVTIVEVDDSWILADIDTPEDYKKVADGNEES